MEEAAAFKKTSGKGKKLRKKNKEKLDLDALEADAPPQADQGSRQAREARLA